MSAMTPGANMNSHDDIHLSRLETIWTEVFLAHQGDGQQIPLAQQKLLHRYRGAIYRYLLASLRDPDAADEVSQEFALKLLKGEFKRADPGRGRFRDFVKTALYHLIVDYH